MTNILVDENTAELLNKAASGLGLSLSDYLRSIADSSVLTREFTKKNTLPWEILEDNFNKLSVDGSLPSDFSRADIYAKERRDYEERI